MNRWVVGFDVRQSRERYVSHRWADAARARYLLRPDIDWPLSVDPRVWPSVFHSAMPGQGDSEGSATIGVDSALEESGFYLTLDRVRTHYKRHRVEVGGGVLIGVELLSETQADAGTLPYTLPEGIACGLSLERTTPERLPDSAALLGYDVANVAWISGLSNTAYTDEELRDLKPAWAHRLNSVGLFDVLDHAISFREVCDRRDRGSAPFWTYALWQLPSC